MPFGSRATRPKLTGVGRKPRELPAAAYAGDGDCVETTTAGKQLIAQTADKKTRAGTLFGSSSIRPAMACSTSTDGENTLQLLH